MNLLFSFEPEPNPFLIYREQPEADPTAAATAEEAAVATTESKDSISTILSKYAQNPESDKAAIEETAKFLESIKVMPAVVQQYFDTIFQGSREAAESSTKKLDKEGLAALKTILGDKQKLTGILDKKDEPEGEPLTEEEQTELKTLTNDSLLQKEDGERLKFVSKNNVSADQLASGKVKEMTFSFDEEGNAALYKNTTAGQVLPPNVRQVVASGPKQDGSTVFTRRGYGGEFFSESGARLKIHNDTAVKVVEGEKGFVGSDKLEEFKKPFLAKAAEGLKKADIKEDTPEYARMQVAAEMAALKGVDVDLALLVAKGKKMSSVTDEAKFKSKFEAALTDAHRIQDGVNPSDLRTGEGRSTLKQAANWVGHYLEGKEATTQGLVGLGYEEADVQKAVQEVGHTDLGAGIDMENLSNIVVTPGGTKRLHPKGYVMRTDRHNNPVASNYAPKFARQLTAAGFVEGVDFWKGEKGPGAGMGTVAYKDFKTGIAACTIALETGQIKRWYGKVGGHQYAYGADKVQRVIDAIQAGGGNITSTTPDGLQEAYNNMPFEGKQGVVMRIYKNEGGGNMFTPITPGQEYLSTRGTKSSY